MKIRQPRIIVASWAPTRDLIWVCAHRPKAAEPPARFIRHTMAPKMTQENQNPHIVCIRYRGHNPIQEYVADGPFKAKVGVEQSAHYNPNKEGGIDLPL